jgi:MoaA/NifB/PqqE/SkfB family radical SAM enzyme
LSPEVAAKVATHPCYSADAHRYYARMHVPVAPGCNIQCNYCNRRFDCANESRPGVTSTLLSPERAVDKVAHVASHVPQMSVVGVAGPGEPLANANRTLTTLELLARRFPDLTLCLSTNGLTLMDHVDRIAAIGVEHVTVTMNAIDPRVGADIYAWVAHRGRRYSGTDAARVLIDRQLEGIAALTERGILCKVNSVLIPGINDEHLVEVSRTVRGLGAFLHNIMPLVSAPEHGTVFGLRGLRGPTPTELADLQASCETLDPDGSPMSMNLMRHCRQCRADAIGMLGEDRHAEFTDPPPDGVTPVLTDPGTPGTIGADVRGCDGSHDTGDGCTGGDGSGTGCDHGTPQRQDHCQSSTLRRALPADVNDSFPTLPLVDSRSVVSDAVAVAVQPDLAERQLEHERIEITRARARARLRERGISDRIEDRPHQVVRIAVASTDGLTVDSRLDRTEEFWVFEAGRDWLRLLQIRGLDRFGRAASDARSGTDRTEAMLSDCAAIVCTGTGTDLPDRPMGTGPEVVHAHGRIEPVVVTAATAYLRSRTGESA